MRSFDSVCVPPLQLPPDTVARLLYCSGPSIAPVCVSRKYLHYSGNRHYSAYFHYWLFPYAPSEFTGTMPGNWHYSIGTVEVCLLAMAYTIATAGDNRCRRSRELEVRLHNSTRCIPAYCTAYAVRKSIGRVNLRANDTHRTDQTPTDHTCLSGQIYP